jgi:hypothetical protein
MKTIGVLTKPLNAVIAQVIRTFEGNIHKKETTNHRFERMVLTVAGLSVAVLFTTLLVIGIFYTV